MQSSTTAAADEEREKKLDERPLRLLGRRMKETWNECVQENDEISESEPRTVGALKYMPQSFKNHLGA